MKRYLILLCIILVCVFSVLPLFAEEEKDLLKLTYGEDKWVALHCLLQTQIYSQNEYIPEKGEGENDAVWSKGFQVRRSRFILNGQVTKEIEFFVQTDDVLIGSQGKGSNYQSSEGDTKGVYTQDAYINYRLRDEFEITLGLMTIPFMHQNMESAASLLGVDYNTTVILPGSISNEWRDTGLLIRGLWQKKIFDYRFGVFRGQPREYNNSTGKTINPGSAPRFSGRLQLNFDEPETGFFYSGNYLGRKNVISVGGGFDIQSNASRIKGDLSDYFAWAADLTVDRKIDQDMVVTFQGGFLNVKNQPESNVAKQWGYYAQAGILLGSIQPVLKYQYWQGNTSSAINIESSYINAGLNYFFRGHNANLKMEYQHPMGKDNKNLSGEKKATIQCQIFL
jgi:hypothetical protein